MNTNCSMVSTGNKGRQHASRSTRGPKTPLEAYTEGGCSEVNPRDGASGWKAHSLSPVSLWTGIFGSSATEVEVRFDPDAGRQRIRGKVSTENWPGLRWFVAQSVERRIFPPGHRFKSGRTSVGRHAVLQFEESTAARGTCPKLITWRKVVRVHSVSLRFCIPVTATARFLN